VLSKPCATRQIWTFRSNLECIGLINFGMARQVIFTLFFFERDIEPIRYFKERVVNLKIPLINSKAKI
jgi:hypothetical protein